jgi:sugar lactone lactonase YvrE
VKNLNLLNTFNALAITLVMACVLTSCSKNKSAVTPTDNTTGLAISSINVSAGPYNTTVEITGTAFSTTLSDNKVSFNDKEGTVTAATATKLVTTVPLGAGTGNIKVTVSGKAVTGPLFTYQLSAITSVFAGSGTKGAKDDMGANASFNTPTGITTDGDGNVYVADQGNNKIRKIDVSGLVSTFSGTGAAGFVNGTVACFNIPTGLTADNAGNVFVADGGNHVIRKITSLHDVSTFSGDGTYGFQDGPPINARFKNPTGIIGDGKGNFYVADPQNSLIRKIDNTGAVSTFAGNMAFDLKDGDGKAASFNLPVSVAIDKNGNLYIADVINFRIRKITPGGSVSTVQTTGSFITQFDGIDAVATDLDGNIYVSAKTKLIKVSSSNVTTVIADNLKDAQGITVDKNGIIYIADTGNNLIRKISMQ